MHIVYFDVVRKTPSIEAAAHASYAATLDELLAQSDCVVLATPARPDGSKVIDARALRQFKHGARFVNVARGSLVDEEALADALDAGVLSSVMLDVHEDEPRVCERLKGRSEVMLTCHNAGGTVDTHIGFERLSMENIEAVLREEMPGSAVNAHLLKTKGR
jgi:lactate dehydrogenase-like 2-hydroxyacid dehydrogenase